MTYRWIRPQYILVEPDSRASLNRSLSRLGQMQARIYPAVMIENELAIAVRRAGVSRVLWALVSQWWWWMTGSARHFVRSFRWRGL